MSDENALAASETAAPAEAISTPVETPTETENKADTTEQGSADAGKSEPEKSDDDAKETKPKPKGRAQERIEELARDRRNLRRTIARLNQQIGQLRAEAPPRLEDFSDEQEFTRANLKRATRETTLEQQFEAVRAEEETLAAKRQEAWHEHVTEARQRFPDFDSVFDGNVPVSESMAELIMESDDPASLAYWLGKNRGEARRISNMQPLEAARELGRVEARLSPPKPKTVSSAPKPVSTVTGKSSAPSSPDLHALAKNEDATAFIEEMRRRTKGA